MRIIFLEAVHNFGGSSKSTLELAKRLSVEGEEVLIVDFWGSSKPFIDNCEKEGLPYKLLDKRETPIMLNNKGKFKRIVNYISYIINTLSYRKKLSSIIAEYKPDLICVNSTKALSILNSSNSYKIAYFARGWFLPNSFGLIDRKLLQNLVDIYLTVSQATRHMVFAGGYAEFKDILVVPNAFDQSKIRSLLTSNQAIIPWFEVEKGSREFVMMHCGSFIETKGQHIAVEVLKKLVDKGIKIKLILVGIVSQADISKKYYKQLLEMINKYKLESHVEIILNESDVMKYYTETDILIHPSSTEGLPRVVLEAMAFGKPVIGNAVGGVTDFILNNYTGYLTNFNAIEEYVEAIELLRENEELYKFISKNASTLIKNNYTYRNQVDEFMKIQRRLSK